MSITNKAGIKRQAVDRYIISSAMVQRYLQNQLGFQVASEFTRWTGVTANHSYVRMRVVINPKDIIAAQPQATGFAERVLQENAAGMMFQDNVMAILRRFMYKENMNPNTFTQEELEKMYNYGIVGNNFVEILTKSKLIYEPALKLFHVYLRPEAIIRDMLTDPKSGCVMIEDEDGTVCNAKLDITGVFGTDSETIRWEVEVSKSNMVNTEIGIIDFDKIFG